MTDPLAEFWVHTVSVQRYNGVTAYGDSYDDPVDVAGFIDDGQRLIVGPDGEQITATATVFFPITTATIPLESLITLPTAFGDRQSRVVAVSRRDAGGLPLPEHLEVHLQ